MSTLLPIAWAGVLCFALCAYLVFDGFDLGIGILLPGTSDRAERDMMVHSISPVWDGNETWLILVAVGALGGFPLAYGILLPAFYLPLFVMIMALAFRGVAFEFRFQTQRGRGFWDSAFFLGSLVAAFCQGLVLGALTDGVKVKDGAFAGGPFDFISAYSLGFGGFVVSSYVLLGASWLGLKTEGTVQVRAHIAARWSLVVIAALTFALAVMRPERESLMTVSLLAVAISGGGWLAANVGRDQERSVFALAAIVVLSLVLRSVVFRWPYIVPPSISLAEASAPRDSQVFLLGGAVVLVPVIVAYSAYSYHVFRGKVVAPPLEVSADL